ncbi:hypothetical protein FOA52_007237 [Chlamydomonas sp. UWO 241]|nr:hypothetical protein FOA52_007237 [Chlamydomonas sp. UWO 241]
MNKINMSVAIVPMAMEFHWSPSVSGVVQSSFFYGYLLCQLPAGYLSSRFGGRTVLPVGVGLWSLATCCLPLLASTIPGLCLSRSLVGLGEAAAPAAAIDLVARLSPPSERSRTVSFIFTGLHFGSIIGLLTAPLIIRSWGWEALFISYGAAGGLWVWAYEAIVARMRTQDPAVFNDLTRRGGASGARAGKGAAAAQRADELDRLGGGNGADAATLANEAEAVRAAEAAADLDAERPVPWRAFVRNGSVRALMYTHFANNWFHYTMLAWLPTYLIHTLGVDLLHAAQTALLPPIAGIAASAAAGPAADAALEAGVPLPLVRKVAQCTAFVLPSALLLAAASPDMPGSETVGYITVALGVSSFSLAGLYCTHGDLSPKYAAPMLSLTNTVGALPGAVGVATVGYLYDTTGSWEAALFLPSAAFMLTAAAAFTAYSTHDPVDFDDAALNAPFAWENALARATGRSP